MKAKIKFKKIFKKMPEEARAGLVYHYWNNPWSLNVLYMEIMNDTPDGKKALKDLGFKDD